MYDNIVEIPCELWCLRCQDMVKIKIVENVKTGISGHNISDFSCPKCGTELR